MKNKMSNVDAQDKINEIRSKIAFVSHSMSADEYRDHVASQGAAVVLDEIYLELAEIVEVLEGVK